jgi:hypothetical protein
MGEALLHWAIGLGILLAREIRIRRDMRKLAELDDRMLSDIGLARTQIEPAARHGRRFLGSLDLPGSTERRGHRLRRSGGM